ncbi:hypothetical protein J6590_051296 [Homalodisca vitripennis]|nr:hypothetical protein J6590_051296 [Homalodisca vitripennis]
MYFVYWEPGFIRAITRSRLRARQMKYIRARVHLISIARDCEIPCTGPSAYATCSTNLFNQGLWGTPTRPTHTNTASQGVTTL